MLEAANEMLRAVRANDDGARGKGALETGADGFGLGERADFLGVVAFEEDDVAQGVCAIFFTDCVKPMMHARR